MKAVLSVVGKDRVGIIAEITKMIAKNNSNIINVEQRIMDDKFTMMMQIEFDNENNFDKLSKEFIENEEKLKLDIKLYNEKLFDNMYSL